MTELKGEQKYLLDDSLLKVHITLTDIELSSNDTINEELLLNTIQKTGKLDELFHATVQMALVGTGGKQFNNYIYKGQTKKFELLFQQCSVAFKNTKLATLLPSMITPRRLIRIFRCHIKKLLELRPDLSSYLYNKYSDHNSVFRTTCFPGAENLNLTKDQANYLWKAYKKLDAQLKDLGKDSGISDRIKRIFLAKNTLCDYD